MYLDFSGKNGVDGRDGRPGRDGRDGATWKDSKGNTKRGPGGDGTDGGDATDGKDATNGIDVKGSISLKNNEIILTTNGKTSKITELTEIDTSGGSGGDGGNGGRGGRGGSGSPRGSSGHDGAGGSGGDGGDAGNIEIATDDSHLLGLLTFNNEGGKKGEGGYGSPSGKNGRSGSDGQITLIHNNNGKKEKDEVFGLRLCDVRVTDDGSQINNILTKGSGIKIESVNLSNQNRITVKGPFNIKISKDYDKDPIDIESESVTENGIDIEYNTDIDIKLNTKVRISDAAKYGFYRLILTPISTRVGIDIDLSDNHETFSYPITVNHRLSDVCIASLADDDQLRQAFTSLFHAKPPDEQATMIYYLLHKDLIKCKQDLNANMTERISAAISSAGGGLVSPAYFRDICKDKELNSLMGSGSINYWVIATDFFTNMPLEDRQKLVDTLIVIASCDMKFTSTEKSSILQLARSLSIEDSYLQENAPWLFSSNTSSMKAHITNFSTWLCSLFVTVILTNFGMWMVLKSNAGESELIPFPSIFNTYWFVTLKKSAEEGSFFHLLFGFIVIYIIVIAITSSLFRKACPSCKSIRLTEKDSSQYRCMDCGLITGKPGLGFNKGLTTILRHDSKLSKPIKAQEVYLIDILNIGLGIISFLVNPLLFAVIPLIVIVGVAGKKKRTDIRLYWVFFVLVVSLIVTLLAGAFGAFTPKSSYNDTYEESSSNGSIGDY